MPNYCMNELTITGEKQTLDRIVKRHTKEMNLDFDSIIPYPQVCRDKDKELQAESGFEHAFSKEGYNWCVENWGTKWNSFSSHYDFHTDTELHMDFDTAWTPPVPVVIQLAKMYPDAKFVLSYREEGCCFYGKLVCEYGQVVEEWCKEIPESELDYEEEEEWAEVIDG